MSYKVLSTCKVFGGTLTRATHASAVTKCEMTFAVFMPEVAEGAKVPALYYLSGLTCTDENVMGKSGAQRAAAQHGIALIAPDTSPRAPAPLPAPGLRCSGLRCSGHSRARWRAGGYEGYDFSKGAGFDDDGWDFGSGASAPCRAIPRAAA